MGQHAGRYHDQLETEFRSRIRHDQRRVVTVQSLIVSRVDADYIRLYTVFVCRNLRRSQNPVQPGPSLCNCLDRNHT